MAKKKQKQVWRRSWFSPRLTVLAMVFIVAATYLLAHPEYFALLYFGLDMRSYPETLSLIFLYAVLFLLDVGFAWCLLSGLILGRIEWDASGKERK